jgi:uncharacterized protein (TIRG00374 family)
MGRGAGKQIPALLPYIGTPSMGEKDNTNMKKIKKIGKLSIGILISLVFMYLAFRKVNLEQMIEAFKLAKYWYIVPAVLVMFLSYWLRSFRWRYLMAPVKRIETSALFSSLLIGYMANSFLPAHLGEFVRAYVIGKKKDIPSSTVLASIIIERILDVLTLIALMGLTVIVFPFPGWVKRSGYIFLAVVVLLFLALVLMKMYQKQSLAFIAKFTRWLPTKLEERINGAFRSLIDGIVPLMKKNHYLKVFVLTVLIWFCYAVSFQILFYSFSFVENYSLPWLASLVLLVLTTIGILVPSSPGYIGVYHFLCQVGLGFFGVPKGAALSYAFVMHGINFFPIIVVGLILVAVNKIKIRNFDKDQVTEPAAS